MKCLSSLRILSLIIVIQFVFFLDAYSQCISCESSFGECKTSIAAGGYDACGCNSLGCRCYGTCTSPIITNVFIDYNDLKMDFDVPMLTEKINLIRIVNLDIERLSSLSTRGMLDGIKLNSFFVIGSSAIFHLDDDIFILYNQDTDGHFKIFDCNQKKYHTINKHI